MMVSPATGSSSTSVVQRTELGHSTADKAENRIKEGEYVLLFYTHDSIFGVTVERSKATQNKFGNFYHDDIIGASYGSRVVARKSADGPTTKGFTTVLRPSPELITCSLVHRTQIIYHADISLILMLLDIQPGSRIIEAGTGSGSLSTSIAHCLRPNGRLYTFEFHEERQKQVVEMFKRNGDLDVITSQHGDACAEGFEGKVDGELVDGVFLDLPMPWSATSNALKVLKPNGKLCTFSPCIEQVAKSVSAMRAENMTLIRTFECLCKPWNLHSRKEKNSERGTKRARGKDDDPQTDNQETSASLVQLPMRGHTSYITIATKILDDEDDFLILAPTQ